MKIEKVNDNQIRCTLTREDLDSRHIKLSELAYGTDKAKSLFRELMEQASYELGFDAEDIPLMIEAVPLTTDSILLIVTKVEYPEELDTRFSRFSEDTEMEEPEEYDDIMTPSSSSANDIIDLFHRAKEAAATVQQTEDGTSSTDGAVTVPVDITKMFCFTSLDSLIRLAHALNGFYHGENLLFKNPGDNLFYLVVSKSAHTPEEFNKTCNILTEYGSQGDFSVGQLAYYKEHYQTIIGSNALASLAQL